MLATEYGIPEARIDSLLNGSSLLSESDLQSICARMDDITKYGEYTGKPFQTLFAKELCSTMKVQENSTESSATISFVSALAGLMLAAEMVKSASPELSSSPVCSGHNYLQISLFSPAAFNLARRVKDDNCRCRCQNEIMRNA